MKYFYKLNSIPELIFDSAVENIVTIGTIHAS